jgi:amino acid transporter
VEERERSLRRILGAGAITVYAVGDILGAGIYALVGKVVAEAQGGAWVSFVISAVIALLTGLTYAELWLVAFLVGIFVLASGITSAATIANASVGYLNSFVVLPPIVASMGLILLMTAINFMGIQESARVNFVLTMIELGGLLLVIGVGVYYAASYVPAAEMSARLRPSGEVAPLLSAATVAFFAYIGFEDTANVAEEVRDARRVLPRAILVAISFTCVLYVIIAAVALLVVPMGTLARSEAPLLEVLNTAGVHLPANTFSLNRPPQPDHGLAPRLRHGARGPAAGGARRSSPHPAHPVGRGAGGVGPSGAARGVRGRESSRTDHESHAARGLRRAARRPAAHQAT